MEFPVSESIYPAGPKTWHLYPPLSEIESQYLHVGKSVQEDAKLIIHTWVCYQNEAKAKKIVHSCAHTLQKERLKMETDKRDKF